MKLSKVYCKDCKWVSLIDSNWCKFKPKNLKDMPYFSWFYYRKPSAAKNPKYYIHADRQNENNDCSHYKRKWWKFWIKEA